MNNNHHDHPFILLDCSLARRATGRSCINLRELLDAVRDVDSAVLMHHMMRCALEDYFELNEFPNDLARWCWDALGERPLAERLALINPYGSDDVEVVRHQIIEALEERLWGLDRIPWARSGLELHLIESQLVVFDSGERFRSPAELARALAWMPTRSLFYHVREAQLMTPTGHDDFSAWLESIGADAELVRRIRSIDYYFLNLNQLRRHLQDIFAECVVDPHAVLVGDRR